MTINETVLEMHYHSAIMQSFCRVLGVGNFQFYKYSPQNECFVGFDQAYVRTQLSADDLLRLLNDIHNGANPPVSLIGWFMQFKVVSPISGRSKNTPPFIRAPYYRSRIDTFRNDRTGRSQHETLFKYSTVSGMHAYYVCPMLFDRDRLYLPSNLDELRFVDVRSAPSAYIDNQKHHIVFQNENSNPIWCSDPKEGISLSNEEFVSGLVDRSNNREYRYRLMNLVIEELNIARERRYRGSRFNGELFTEDADDSGLRSLSIIITAR